MCGAVATARRSVRLGPAAPGGRRAREKGTWPRPDEVFLT